MRLVLASRSEARRRMLEAAGVPFEVAAAPLGESEAKAGLAAAGFEPRDLAEMLAEMKAKSAAAPPDSLVLGADQVLETEEGEMLSKPESREAAAAQLRSLAGRRHFLHSAAVLVENGHRSWGCTDTAALTMRPLSEEFLIHYLDRDYETVRGSVGAYHVEGRGAQLFEEVRGSYFVVLGLPLLPLLEELRGRGILAR